MDAGVPHRATKIGLQDAVLLSALLFLCAVVLFHDLGGAALFEPDEGRNAEVAREILITGNWVTPHYDFIPRLDKPIFYYWFVAASYKLFGISEFAARLPSAVAALACILCVLAFAIATSGFSEALWSGLVLATGVEFFALSRIAIMDMLLTFFITLALCAFYVGASARRSGMKTLLYATMYLSMGIAGLTKGPIGIVLPASIILLYLCQTKNWFLLKDMRPSLGIPAVLAIAGSWYVWAELNNPGTIRYFFVEENVLRFLTPRFNRNQPSWYFFSVLLIGFLPWTLLLAFVAEDLWKRPLDDATVLLATWVLVPLVFFSFSHSKLPHYILPLYPPLSILAGRSLCRVFRDRSGKRRWALSLPWLSLAAALFMVVLVASRPDGIPDHIRTPIQQFAPTVPLALIWAMLAIFLGLALICSTAVWKRSGVLYLSYCLGFFLVFVAVHRVMATVSQRRSSKALAAKAAPLIDSHDRVFIYDAYFSSLPFYLRIAQPMAVVWSGKNPRVMGSTYVAEQFARSESDHGDVLFTYEQFSKMWKDSSSRIVVFARAKDMARLNRLTSAKTILQSEDVLLLANK